MRRSLLAAALLCVSTAGCNPPTIISSATPASPGASHRALVLGRIQVFLSGQPASVGPAAHEARVRGSEWTGGSGWDEPAPLRGGERAATAITFRNVLTGKRFAYEVEDDSGRFEVLLPPGQYAIKLRYDEWLSDTPARFDAPEAGEPCYVGTLHADLFRRRSFRGSWARIFGGAVPSGDSDFRVRDEWEWAQDNLRFLAAGAVTPQRCLMRLEAVR